MFKRILLPETDEAESICNSKHLVRCFILKENLNMCHLKKKNFYAEIISS